MSSSIPTSANSQLPQNLTLKQQVMLNQFTTFAGCSYEQSLQLLASSKWQYQVALSTFLNDIQINSENTNKLCVNTPVTPPNFEFMEQAFSKLKTSTQSNEQNESHLFK